MYLLEMNPILAAMAIIPAVVLMVKVYKEDKIEKEPVGLLLLLILEGIISTFIAIALEEIGSYVLGIFFDENTLVYNIIMYFLVVGFSEEGAKYFLLKRKTWKSKNFNCRFDGVVYAVFVSLGFALWENIGYVANYGFETALVRAVTAVPGHACFGVFMGICYGTAKMYQIRGKKSRSDSARHKALWIPILMHGTYDFLTTLGNGFSLIWVAFVAFMFILAWRLIKKSSAGDEYFVQQNPDYFDRNGGTPPYYGNDSDNYYNR